MDSRWLDHIDSHIAAGQVAAEAESAELLSWLLKLEPEQRWCLVLSRDKRLERLSAADYPRLLSLMVEHEAKALAGAPRPPQGCFQDLAEPPAPEPVPRRVRRMRRSGLLLLVALAAAAALGASRLTGRDGGEPLAHLGQRTAELLRSLRGGLPRLTDIDDRVTRDMQTTERLQHLMTARSTLEALEHKLTTGKPFAVELAALRRVWPVPAELAPLEEPATRGTPAPEALRAGLARLQQGLDAKRSDAMTDARTGQLSVTGYYARIGALSSLQKQGEEALAAIREDDWTGARQALEAVEDPDYQAWLEQLDAWLQIRAVVTELSSQLWSRWLEGLPQETAAEVQ